MFVKFLDLNTAYTDTDVWEYSKKSLYSHIKLQIFFLFIFC